MDIKQWTFVHHLENLDYIFSSNPIIKHMSYAHIALAGVDRSSPGLWKPHWFGWIRGHLSVAHTQKDVQIANIWAVKWKEVQPKLEQTISARSCSIICGSTFEASSKMKGRRKTCWMKRWRIDRDKRRRGKKKMQRGKRKRDRLERKWGSWYNERQRGGKNIWCKLCRTWRTIGFVSVRTAEAALKSALKSRLTGTHTYTHTALNSVPPSQRIDRHKSMLLRNT